MALLYLTIDHQVIFSWARHTGALPSTFEGDERPWPILFNFGPPGSGLREISWEKFFAEFEQANLVFVYRDAGPNGEPDDSYEFVGRAAVPELMISGKSTITEEVI